MVNKVKIIQKLAIVVGKKILVLRRSDFDKLRPGTWDFPGGNVDNEDVVITSNDILQDALKREINEEIGWDFGNSPAEIVYIDSGFSQKDNLVIWLGYMSRTSEHINVALSHEHSAFRWVAKEEYFKLDFGYATSLLEQGKKVFEILE